MKAQRKGLLLCDCVRGTCRGERGRRGWGRLAGKSRMAAGGWVKEEGRTGSGWCRGRGSEGLYESTWGGSGDVDAGRIWFRVRRGCSQWKGFVGDGLLRPERKGLLCILLGGFEGMRVSRLTSEAPVGPRKASGVLHKRVEGVLRRGASRDKLNISGLAVSLPLTRGLAGGSVPNGSTSPPANGSGVAFTVNSSASVGLAGRGEFT